jgi:hypothetical protein
VTTCGGLDISDLSFPMKFAKVSLINAKQLSCLAAGQAAHDFLGVGREVRRSLRMKVLCKKLCVVPDGDIQVLL